MKRLALLVMVLVWALAACGGNTATTTGGVQPAANAPVIEPVSYVENYAETDHYLLDVRENSEVARGVIPGAAHIPLGQLQQRVSEIPTDKPVIVYCNSGNRSREAVRILNSAGYDQLLDLQGIQQWQRAGYDLVPLQ